jgi:hypothetical protein
LVLSPFAHTTDTASSTVRRSLQTNSMVCIEFVRVIQNPPTAFTQGGT